MTMEMPLNIISPKSLEKQLKVVENRMSVLAAEMAELEKIRNACLVLMGTTAEAFTAPTETAGPVTKSKKKKATSEDEILNSEDLEGEEPGGDSLATH